MRRGLIDGWEWRTHHEKLSSSFIVVTLFDSFDGSSRLSSSWRKFPSDAIANRERRCRSRLSLAWGPTGVVRARVKCGGKTVNNDREHNGPRWRRPYVRSEYPTSSGGSNSSPLGDRPPAGGSAAHPSAMVSRSPSIYFSLFLFSFRSTSTPGTRNAPRASPAQYASTYIGYSWARWCLPVPFP